jgi:amidase
MIAGRRAAAAGAFLSIARVRGGYPAGVRAGSIIIGAVLALAGCAGPGTTRAPGAGGAVDVVELDVSEAQRRMAAGTLTSVALTRAYLERIAAIDDAGPRLAAVIEVDPQAEAQARRLDEERAAGRVRGPLHGVPVLIKDNIEVAGMVTSAGSLALARHRTREDAALVARLREAGAVILGKTNLSEWANFRGENATSGWSSRGGQTRNPYVLDRTPCGSSSGTGAAIAASLATVGVGTETDGSILCPSAVSGLVGLKPTVGLISRRGVVPISSAQDTAGPMTRSVRDAALLLAAMAGADPQDPAAARVSGRVPDYVAGLRTDALKGQRIGVLRQAMGDVAAVDAATERAIAALRAGGAEIVDPVELATWGRWDEAEFLVLLYEFKDGIERWLRTSGAPLRSLAELIAWNERHADAVMPWFGQEIFKRALAVGGLDTPAYVEAAAKARRLAWDEGLKATLEKHRLTAIVAPTLGGPAWPIDHVLGDRFSGAGFQAAAIAGTPSLTVPMGEVHGLPIGLAFLGAPESEATLLALGYAFEQATKSRRPPRFVPTLE